MEPLKRGLADAALLLKPMPEKERDEVLTVIAEMLQKKITFRKDGTASAVHHLSGDHTTHVEWRNFKVTSINAQSVSEADKANGITRRYFVGFACAASRTWEAKVNRWSEWRSSGYILFPGGARVEEVNGVLKSTLGEHGQFLPGPGSAAGAGATQPAPAGKQDQDLPPGMKRAGQ